MLHCIQNHSNWAGHVMIDIIENIHHHSYGCFVNELVSESHLLAENAFIFTWNLEFNKAPNMYTIGFLEKLQ